MLGRSGAAGRVLSSPVALFRGTAEGGERGPLQQRSSSSLVLLGGALRPPHVDGGVASWVSGSSAESSSTESGTAGHRGRGHRRRQSRRQRSCAEGDGGVSLDLSTSESASRQCEFHLGGHRGPSSRHSKDIAKEVVPSQPVATVTSTRLNSVMKNGKAPADGRGRTTEGEVESHTVRNGVEKRVKKKKRIRKNSSDSVMSLKTTDLDNRESDLTSLAFINRRPLGRHVSQSTEPPDDVFIVNGKESRVRLPMSLNIGEANTDEPAVLPSHRMSGNHLSLKEEKIVKNDVRKKGEMGLNDKENESTHMDSSAEAYNSVFLHHDEAKEHAQKNLHVVKAIPELGLQQEQLPRELAINTEHDERDAFCSEGDDPMDAVPVCIPTSPQIMPQPTPRSTDDNYSPRENERKDSWRDSEPESGTDTDLSSFLMRPSSYPCASGCVDRSDPDSWKYNRPRQHGFQFPLHNLQITALSLTGISTILFWCSVVPGYILLYRSGGYSNTLPALVILVTLAGSAILSTCILWCVVSFVENGDYSNEGESCVYCHRLTSLDSRHCKACNKCITGFDHHCKWLNMCIGEKNYRFFIGFVVSSLLSMTFSLMSSILLLALWWNGLSAFSWFFRVGPIILSVMLLAGMAPLMHLLAFHIRLRCLGLTTFEYIMKRRRRVILDPHAEVPPPDDGKEFQTHEGSGP